MSWSGKRKPIYDLGDISDRLGLNLMDVGTLIVEHDVRFCTPVAGLPVEVGRGEEINLLDQQRVPVECQELTGLVDLRPQDAIAVLRDGGMTLRWLAAERPGYIRIGGLNAEHAGHEVNRHEIGIRPEDMVRLQRIYGEDTQGEVVPMNKQRGPQPVHDWRAIEREAARRCFFDGVPESKNALIRHIQAWCAATGRPVPDESTLKRELKEFWQIYGPEAQRRQG